MHSDCVVCSIGDLVVHRISVAQEARKLGRNPTLDQETAILGRRNRLQTQIDEFHAESRRYLGQEDLLTNLSSEEDERDWNLIDDEDEIHAPLEGHQIIDEQVVVPEKQCIALPSSVRQQVLSPSLIALREKELTLRIGQANDALADLRVSIANRAIMFRTTIRTQRNYRGATRAWRQMEGVSDTTKRAGQVYTLARKAMHVLGASRDLLSRYKTLTQEDLKADTETLNFNEPGRRNNPVSWIWTMSEGGIEPEEIKEGMWFD